MSANLMTVEELIIALARFDPRRRVVINSMTYDDRTECDIDGPYRPFLATGHEIRSGWFIPSADGKCVSPYCDLNDDLTHEKLVVISDRNTTTGQLQHDIWGEE